MGIALWYMQTHVKEAAATLLGAGALIAVIHGGIWFTLFGTPDFEVLGFPFHYFWLVAGGPTAMFIIYWGYYQFISRTIQDEKDAMATAADGGQPVGVQEGGEAE